MNPSLPFGRRSVIPRHRHELTLATFCSEAFRRQHQATMAVESFISNSLSTTDSLLLPSGRAAIYWALRAAPEPTVIVPAFTCYVVVEAALLAGKKVRFVDVDPATYNAGPEEIEHALESGSILIATHQFGFPIDIEAVVDLAHKKGCRVIEDCAGGLGGYFRDKPLGGTGNLSIFSFQHTKTASAWNAGLLTGRDSEWFETTRSLWLEEGNKPSNRVSEYVLPAVYAVSLWPPLYGRLVLPYFLRTKGMTASEAVAEPVPPPDLYFERVSEFQARLVLRGLHRLEEIGVRRTDIAQTYREGLESSEGVVLPTLLEGARPLPIRYPIRIQSMSREEFYQGMLARGIDLGFSFSYCCAPPEQESDFPGAKILAREVVNLPIYSRLDGDGSWDIAERARLILSEV